MNRLWMFLVGATLVSLPASAVAETLQGTLYKAQQCDCCKAHAEYLRKNGIDLKIESVKNLDEVSLSAGVPPGFQGCHVIKLNGYVFEGHITSKIIKRFLSERPKDLIGLSIPGMPSGVLARRRPTPSNELGRSLAAHQLAQRLF
jgi:hypothetical protein